MFRHPLNFSSDTVASRIHVSSTPDSCVDVVVCRAWDDSGSTAEARFWGGNITGLLGCEGEGGDRERELEGGG